MTARDILRRFADALTHTGPSYQPDPLPRRGDHVERWLKEHRDWVDEQSPEWPVLDRLLDAYRLHADTRSHLDQHTCEGGTVDDCWGCYLREAQR